jgi:sodium-dependent dicarboxylate transporter 2/3/5
MLEFMNLEIGMVLGILAAAIILLISNKLGPDIVAVLIAVALLICRSLTITEVLAGFGNPAVIAIAAIFIVSTGLTNTGLAEWIGRCLLRIAGRSEARLTAVSMAASAMLSLVMTNMASVAVLLPGLSVAARQTRISPSKLLIPLSFGSLLGGMATLFTTVNLLVNHVLRQKGFNPFSLWDFFSIGSIAAVAGIVFMAGIGRRLLPERVAGSRLPAPDRSAAALQAGLAEAEGNRPEFCNPAHNGRKHANSAGLVYRSRKAPFALAGMALMLVLAGAGILSLAAAAAAGALVTMISGTVTIREGIRAIEWKALVMVGGMLSMGAALEKSGAADLISRSLFHELAPFGHLAVLAGFFLVPMLLTQVLSSAATGVLLAPIALSAANQLHISAYPALMAVILGASCCFLTPMSHPSNVLVLAPGGYHFGDYARAGALLTVIVFLLSMLLIPVLWPF